MKFQDLKKKSLQFLNYLIRLLLLCLLFFIISLFVFPPRLTWKELLDVSGGNHHFHIQTFYQQWLVMVTSNSNGWFNTALLWIDPLITEHNMKNHFINRDDQLTLQTLKIMLSEEIFGTMLQNNEDLLIYLTIASTK